MSEHGHLFVRFCSCAITDPQKEGNRITVKAPHAMEADRMLAKRGWMKTYTAKWICPDCAGPRDDWSQ